MKLTPRGLYFEEFEVGQEIQTAARTITETDIVNFAVRNSTARIEGNYRLFRIV